MGRAQELELSLALGGTLEFGQDPIFTKSLMLDRGMLLVLTKMAGPQTLEGVPGYCESKSPNGALNADATCYQTHVSQPC